MVFTYLQYHNEQFARDLGNDHFKSNGVVTVRDNGDIMIKERDGEVGYACLYGDIIG